MWMTYDDDDEIIMMIMWVKWELKHNLILINNKMLIY
jgi:hypothetical protein